MKTPYRLRTRLTQSTTIMALAAMILVSTGARAEGLGEYQPEALIQAEHALEQGNPERALALLHRQRAILSHKRFHAQRQALACQAYVQQQDFLSAQQACVTAVAYAGDQSTAEAHAASGD